MSKSGRLRLVVLAVICVGMISMAGVRAQESPVSRIAFDHDGKGVTGFALYVQPEKGKPIRVDLGLVPADEGGSRSAPLPVLPEGQYAFSVAAYNSAGESARASALPRTLRIMKVEDRKGAADSKIPESPIVPATTDVTPAKAQKTGGWGKLLRVIVGD